MTSLGDSPNVGSITHTFFWFLFDLMVTKSFILCRDFTDLPDKSVKDFRVTLAKDLIGSYASRTDQAHFPTREQNGQCCHHCYHNKKQRHQTVWFCKDCNIFLCHNGRDDDCFREYHLKYGASRKD